MSHVERWHRHKLGWMGQSLAKRSSDVVSTGLMAMMLQVEIDHTEGIDDILGCLGAHRTCRLGQGRVAPARSYVVAPMSDGSKI